MQSNILKHIIFQFIFKHLAGIVHPRPTPSPQIVAIDPDFKKVSFSFNRQNSIFQLQRVPGIISKNYFYVFFGKALVEWGRVEGIHNIQ